MIIKARRNIRYHYNEPDLFIYGPNEKIKLKLSVSEYENITSLISKAYQGSEETELFEEFMRYRKLTQFLIEKHIFYLVDPEIYNIHKSSIYLPWVEEHCLSVEKGLKEIEKICVNIPQSFFGATCLKELLEENQIKSEITNVENIEVLTDGKIVAKYHIGKKGERIWVSTRNHRNFEEVSAEDISEKLLSGFLFYSAIISAIGKNFPVFNINTMMEVERKVAFDGIEKVDYQFSGRTHQDAIKNFNSLEIFVKKYDSKIVSFNNDKAYFNYNQSPLQVITVQTEDEENYYFADISYERLAQFLAEAAFLEILKNSYSKELLLKQQEKIIYSTQHDKTGELFRLDLNELEESDLISSLLNQEKLSVNFYLQSCVGGGYYLYVVNNDSETLIFQIPVRTAAQLTTVILTWISMYKNDVSVKESFFKSVDLNEFRFKEDGSLNWNISIQEKQVSGQQTTVGKILDENGFEYELLEVE
ncbi:hypothetical protein [Lysinibacillus sp.]|uniref:hypothetical protein n=1 Tax=Lysinibacillus sp. TaxID=1869345 RepID=UPI0028AA0DD4|nr:hypothetical protein [Lysinibacillus sp.]